MTELTQAENLMEMRENIRRAVHSLDVCWRCQRVSECQKYILGNLVLVWLCQGCMGEMEQSQPPRPKRRSRVPAL
ncbi:MAG: hypothetical protein HY651_12815 [Acidobacteria bacterium]|nr:hypothetical protein [Acidobacteriota bacterium]